MTERHAAYLVTLDEDMREDDAEAVVHALRMVRGVAGVTPVDAAPDIGKAVARVRADNEWRERLLRLLREARDDRG